MKITVEHYDEKISIELEHNDLSLDDFMGYINRIASAIYDPKSVEDYWK